MCFEENSKRQKISVDAVDLTYMGRCVTTQGIQEKRHLDITTYGSGVIVQNVKWAVIAPP